ncbi:hypothetical protein GCM10029992_09350 [Glycomyces albus]
MVRPEHGRRTVQRSLDGLGALQPDRTAPERPALAHAEPGKELPSEGIVAGSLQVPPNGQPILFGADHPTTGGYPVLGVVGPAAQAAGAQARPGTRIKFVPLPLPQWSI